MQSAILSYYLLWLLIFSIGQIGTWELIGRSVLWYDRHPKVQQWLHKNWKWMAIPIFILFLIIWMFNPVVMNIIPPPGTPPPTQTYLMQCYAFFHSFAIASGILVLIHWNKT